MSQYAKQENGEWKLVPRPRWYEDLEGEPGAPVTDATLIENGVYPVELVIPAHDSRLQRVERLPAAQWTLVNDTVQVPYEVIDKPLTELIGDVAAERFEAEAKGVIWSDSSTSRVFFLDTTIESQNRFASVRLAVEAGVRADGAVWKCAEIVNGTPQLTYRPTTNTEIATWASLVHEHVQRCFEAEAITVGKLVSGDMTASFADELAALENAT